MASTAGRSDARKGRAAQLVDFEFCESGKRQNFSLNARALEVIETVTKSLLVKFDVISLRLWVEIQAAWSERE
jgi:hypothetical protein